LLQLRTATINNTILTLTDAFTPLVATIHFILDDPIAGVVNEDEALSTAKARSIAIRTRISI